MSTYYASVPSGHMAAPPTAPFVPPPVQHPAAGQSRLTVVSLVVSLVALFGVLVLSGLLLASGALAGGSQAPLTGQLTTIPGGSLRGADLAGQLTTLISDDGGEVTELRCPDTPSVGQGVVTVCHGSISGSPWAVLVFFEDTQGHFTVQPV